MNADEIIYKILDDKNAFLDKYHNKEYFNKSTKHLFDLLSSENCAFITIANFVFFMLISLIIHGFFNAYFPEIKNYTGSLYPFLLMFSGVFTTLTANKMISRIALNILYKNRAKNNIISRFFKDDFYYQKVSNEVHNMLKVYLSDDDYISLVKKGLSYRNAYNTLTEIIESEKILSAKRNVFLTPEEIKKYQYISIN